MKRIIFSMLSLAFSAGAVQGLASDAKKASLHDLAPQVSLDDFKKIVADKSAVIIDANGASTYEKGHVPGAVSFASTEGKLASVLPADKNKLIVAYCGGTMCSAWEAAAKEAKQLGYTNIKHFKGGIKGWSDAGMPIEGAKVPKKSA